MEPCEFHCERGWLPDDGITDDADGLPLLEPLTYLCCPCNPLYSRNDELEAVV